MSSGTAIWCCHFFNETAIFSCTGQLWFRKYRAKLMNSQVWYQEGTKKLIIGTTGVFICEQLGEGILRFVQTI